MSGPLTIHGGRLGDARARFGGEPGDWLDLSTGINPVSWPCHLAPAPDWGALPDPRDLARLEEVAATRFGTSPRSCVAVAGSEFGLRAVARLLKLPGVHRPLCYGTHGAAFASATTIPDLDEVPRTPAVLVLANPNNPDGGVTGRADLLAALERQERAGGWLLVDEAFADCRPEWSVADLVAEDRRLVVTRSFGKFFGLAGVRLGFVLAPSTLLDGLRRLQGEWPVCAAAIAFGTAAYADSAWIAETRIALGEAAARLDALLARHGLDPRGECPLFRLVDTDDAGRLFARLATRHILTRPFAAHPRLLRFGLPPDEAAMARLEAALG